MEVFVVISDVETLVRALPMTLKMLNLLGALFDNTTDLVRREYIRGVSCGDQSQIVLQAGLDVHQAAHKLGVLCVFLFILVLTCRSLRFQLMYTLLSAHWNICAWPFAIASFFSTSTTMTTRLLVSLRLHA